MGLQDRVARAVRSALTQRGIEVRRTSRGVRRTLPAVLAYYREHGFAPATVIDVGVAAGTPEIYDAFPDARLVLVEPMEEWRGELEQLSRRRKTELVFAAAGSAAGDTELAVHRVPALSSIIGLRPNDSAVTPRQVPVIRVDDLKRELSLTGPFLLKIDVEGGELEVLSGALDVLRECELVLLEVSFFQLVRDAPQFHDVVAWMHEHGFVVGDLYNGHNRPLDGALAMLDVAFVQEHGPFRRDHAYGTSDQNDALYRRWGY